MIYTIMYLAAIVAANLTAAVFGASAVIINAFLFIGLDLTARDKLHSAWSGNGLLWKMTALIASGSLLSYTLNRDAAQIAMASLVAFAVAAAVDTVAFHLLRNQSQLLRVNSSNVPSAFVDSLVFPTLAFGGFAWPLVIGQFAAKVAGGFFWSIVLRKTDKPLPVTTAQK